MPEWGNSHYNYHMCSSKLEITQPYLYWSILSLQQKHTRLRLEWKHPSKMNISTLHMHAGKQLQWFVCVIHSKGIHGSVPKSVWCNDERLKGGEIFSFRQHDWDHTQQSPCTVSVWCSWGEPKQCLCSLFSFINEGCWINRAWFLWMIQTQWQCHFSDCVFRSWGLRLCHNGFNCHNESAMNTSRRWSRHMSHVRVDLFNPNMYVHSGGTPCGEWWDGWLTLFFFFFFFHFAHLFHSRGSLLQPPSVLNYCVGRVCVQICARPTSRRTVTISANGDEAAGDASNYKLVGFTLPRPLPPPSPHTSPWGLLH